MSLLWNLLEEADWNNVHNVNFGLKKTKDAIIWHVDVNINSAMFAADNGAEIMYVGKNDI